jgi:hypothetical protein
MCDSKRPTEGADSACCPEAAYHRPSHPHRGATGIDRELILERVEVYRPPVRVPEWVRRAQEQRLVTKDLTGGKS